MRASELPPVEHLVVVSDRDRLVAALRALAGRRLKVLHWGFGGAEGADESLREVLRDREYHLARAAAVLVDLPPRHATKVAHLVQEDFPRVGILLTPRALADGTRHDRFVVTDPGEAIQQWLSSARDLAVVRSRVEHLKGLLEEKRHILILTHPNPDPDAIASALGLRTVLGRNRQTATIGYLGRPLSRPENLTMIELLEIDLQRINEEELPSYDAIILVDCQENVLANYDLPQVTAVIDHHPDRAEYHAPYRDVVPEEGSTSTIITRYLQALQIQPSERLATALLYGIKTDTFFLKREVNADDLESFLYLYPRAKINDLRRIEDPQLALPKLRLMGRAMQAAELYEDLMVMGIPDDPEASEDLVARLADYGLYVKGANWSLAYALIDDSVIISVRNVGYVRHAGRAVDTAFGRFGPSGGHRSSARAILDRTKLTAELGTEPWEPAHLRDWIVSRFLEVIRPEENGGS